MASVPDLPGNVSPPPGMVAIPAGTYELGAGGHYPEELPARKVTTTGFYMDRTEVTNAQFAEFVKATGYKTFAERAPTRADGPPAGSACFHAAGNGTKPEEWWAFKEGVSWKHPGGPKTDMEGRMNMPVVHIVFEDAEAYAKWAGKELPTEDQWEIAARGGLVNRKFEWGDEFSPEGIVRANTYQGEFPEQDLGSDGFKGLAPVGRFPANNYGLFDMTGNAWELTRSHAPKDGPSGQATHWAKGGSFLCAANYCARYRPAARIPVTVDTSTEHIGFRCIKRF